jgi:DNA repair protein RadD
MRIPIELVARKSALILDLQAAKTRRENRAVRDLSSRAAVLERQIADQLLAVDAVEDAAVNLLSAASCFVDAARYFEATRAFRIALEHAQSPAIRRWIQERLEHLHPEPEAGAVFLSVPIAVDGNPSLRRPQVEAYLAAQTHFARSAEHALIQLPVGCGKTGTMAVLPFGLSKGRTLVVAPNLEIAGNLWKNLDYSNPDCFLRKRRILLNGHGPTCAVLDGDASIADADASDYVVGNIQQLVAGQSEKWLSHLPSDYFDLVLFDEGHHNAADSWRQVHARFPRAKFTSFTATPIRTDGKPVEGAPIYRFPIADAIREGYIKDLASRRLEPSTIEFTFRGSQQRHQLSEVLKLRENDWFSRGVALAPECNRNIVDAAIQCMQELRDGSKVKHQIIGVACSIDHARGVTSLFRERGLSAETLHSQLEKGEQDSIRSRLSIGELDAVVQVQMLGEGADYPTLSVAALFRPFRHLVPYVQFIGRIMRVVRENAPGHPDNRGFVVSHVGLHVDRWWEELRSIDRDDQSFFEALAASDRQFGIAAQRAEDRERRRFQPSMQVLDEQIDHFVQEHFLGPEELALVVDDLVHSLEIRGLDLSLFGFDRDQLMARLASRSPQVQGQVAASPVQPQRARQEARRRLNERVRSGASEALRDLGLKPGGKRLVMLYPELGGNNDLVVATILLNGEVNRFLEMGPRERDLLTVRQARVVHDTMDLLIDAVVRSVRDRMSNR